MIHGRWLWVWLAVALAAGAGQTMVLILLFGRTVDYFVIPRLLGPLVALRSPQWGWILTALGCSPVLLLSGILLVFAAFGVPHGLVMLALVAVQGGATSRLAGALR